MLELDRRAEVRFCSENDLPLQCLYRWEHRRADCVYLTQPYAGGKLREWTWAQVASEVRRMAAYLAAQGWEPGTRIGILAKNCAWWILSDLAIWMAGHVSVPVFSSLKAQSARQILEHSDARACFLGATDDPEMPRAGIPPGVACIRLPTAAAGAGPLWDDVIAATSPMAGEPVRTPDELATIIYTSGSTGAPKGAMHRFEAIGYVARAVTMHLGTTAEDRGLSYLPLAHMMERIMVEAGTLRQGGHIFFSEGIETFLTDLRRARSTTFLAVPRLLMKFQQGVFAKIPKRRLERLLRIPVVRHYVKRRILRQLGLDDVWIAGSGAAALPVEILLWYRNLGLNLVEGYGMTETLITHIPAAGKFRPGYLGPPLHGVEQKIAGNGELLLRSPMNMLGYYKDPEATREAFTEDGFFRTGDLAQIDADGQLRLIGRVKDQFKTSKGKYVTPSPIESRFLLQPEVEACCLMGAGLAAPVAVVLLAPEARARAAGDDARRRLEQSLEARLDQLNAELEAHERVLFVAIAQGPWTIENGTITPTLKIRRAVLEGRYLELVDGWSRRGQRVVWE